MDRGVPLGAAALPLPGGDADVVISRRRLLQAGAFAMAAGSLGLGTRALTEAASRPGAIPLARLTRSAYAPYVGRRFRLSAPRSAFVPVVLSAVDGSEDAFTLIFHADRGVGRVEQAVMHVRHPAGWSIPLLVSPAGTGRRGMDYAAVINRTTPNQRRRS